MISCSCYLWRTFIFLSVPLCWSPTSERAAHCSDTSGTLTSYLGLPAASSAALADWPVWQLWSGRGRNLVLRPRLIPHTGQLSTYSRHAAPGYTDLSRYPYPSNLSVLVLFICFFQNAENNSSCLGSLSCWRKMCRPAFLWIIGMNSLTSEHQSKSFRKILGKCKCQHFEMVGLVIPCQNISVSAL